jgi:hypothetical protein
LDAFFKVIDEIGNEDILVLFDSLIEKFGDEISPYAGQLVARMVRSSQLVVFVHLAVFIEHRLLIVVTTQMAIFMSLVHADLDDDDSICTAMSCMRAANTVLHSLHKLPHMYSALEPVVIPAIEAVLEAQAMDFFDVCLALSISISWTRCGRSSFIIITGCVAALLEQSGCAGDDYLLHLLPESDFRVHVDATAALAVCIRRVRH